MAGEFWQYGLNGDLPYRASGNVTAPYYSADVLVNLNNARVIGSISLNTGKPMDQSYDVLLNTFSLGSQLYARLTPHQSSFTVAYDGSQAVKSSVTHSVQLILKRGNSSISLGDPVGTNVTQYSVDNTAPLGTFSIYYLNYMTMPQSVQFMRPTGAFPRAGVGGGTTNQIAISIDSTGITFYIVGYTSSVIVNDIKYTYSTPAKKIGKLTSATLNDKNWFDPDVDGINPEATDEGPGGGVGGLPTAPDYPGTDMDFPALPTGATAFGFSKLNLFKPTASQLGDALDILYTDSTESTLESIIESCKKWWYKPDQYCIGLMLSPVDASTSVSKNIKFGKYDSEVQASCVTDQFQIVDLGSVTVPLQYGGFLDFSPYAVTKIFLPFIGFRTINVDEIMGSTISCKYYCDMLTGSAVAMLKIARSSSNSSIYYSFDCNLNMQVPLTSNNYSQIVSSVLTAGVSAGMGNPKGAVTALINGASSLGSADLTQSGNLNSNNGVLGCFTPYICIQFPVASQPANYNNIKGKPSDSYVSLGSISGYTVVDNVHLEGITGATDDEIKEIEAMLKSGVIF